MRPPLKETTPLKEMGFCSGTSLSQGSLLGFATGPSLLRRVMEMDVTNMKFPGAFSEFLA
jgi:hypothetical protein